MSQNSQSKPHIQMPAPNQQQLIQRVHSKWQDVAQKLFSSAENAMWYGMLLGGMFRMATAMLAVWKVRHPAAARSAKVLPHTVPHLIFTHSPDEEVHQEDSDNLQETTTKRRDLLNTEMEMNTHTCTHTWKQTHACTHTHTDVYMHARRHTHTTHTQIHTHTYACIPTQTTHTCTHRECS